MSIRLSLCALAVLVAGAPAVAQGDRTALLQARAQGIVGERFDGYLGYAVQPGSNAVRVQTEAINIRRRALYTNLATRRGATVQEVGITAGCTLLGRVAVGEAYMASDGSWRRRAAGQPAPVPEYCVAG